MPATTLKKPPSRGHKKRERTRRQLIAAGSAILAERGEALTVSDVVARAEVSNGTFYNYFGDRDELIDALAEHSVMSLAAESALQTADQDPARRYAVATYRVLRRASREPDWGRVVLRLLDHRRAYSEEIGRYLREDLSAGLREGRFAFGDDEITLDLHLGLIFMSLRRIVRGDAPSVQTNKTNKTDYAERVVERALTTLGVAQEEAFAIAAEVAAAEA